MHNKLQELTDRLYQEGLSKGKEEGAKVLEDARKEAQDIVANAQKEAAAIVEQAQKQADDLKFKVESDVKMASSQALQATKKDIENIVLAKVADQKVADTLADSAFLKEVITAVAKNFSAQESSDLNLVLPESVKGELESFVGKELSEILGKGVQASFSKKIAGGFTIGPKDGGYFISLTDETFEDLIKEYLRPLTKKILFG